MTGSQAEKLDATQKLKKKISWSKSCYYHIITNIFDYAWLGVLFELANYIFIPAGLTLKTISLMMAFIVLFLQIREYVNYIILGDDVAKMKRDYVMSWKDWGYVAQTTAIFTLEGYLGAQTGLFYYTKVEYNWEVYCEVFLMFYILQLSKDFFSLYFLHKWMHDEWYSLHKGHHEVRGNANSLLAFHIDPIDLFFENICSPVVLFAGQYLLGYEVRVHVAPILLVALMDATIHSVNPYAVTLWNPLLDGLFRCNVAHHIHHMLNKDNYMFIPYHHVFPAMRKKDCDRYNEFLETGFMF